MAPFWSKRTVTIRSEVLPFLALALVAGAALFLVLRLAGAPGRAALTAAAAVTLVLAAFLAFFFRDPERRPPADPAAVLAGADGVVMGVDELDATPLLDGPVYRVRVFLSVFDVHVNRAPLPGVVAECRPIAGGSVAAFRDDAGERNARNSLVIAAAPFRYAVVQITGALARRAVVWVAPGDRLAAGQRFGMMKFGSRLDTYLPRGAVTLSVQPGQRVRAGETVIARVNPEDARDR
jgi:phosphatidylserine decarboxylase